MNLIKQALNLYKTAFPNDSDEFVQEFMDRYFENNCRYIIKNGKLVSMLFLLEGSITANNKTYPAYYLYAAATHPEYRRQGLMAELICKVKEETNQKGFLLATKPANKSLYEYYGKFGFKTVFYSKKYHELPNGNNLSVSDYISKREEFLKSVPHFTLKDIEYAISSFRLVGNENFCAAIEVTEKGEQIKECVFSSVNIEDFDQPFAMLLTPPNTTFPNKLYFGIAMD